jgi:hypothetical protein
MGGSVTTDRVATVLVEASEALPAKDIAEQLVKSLGFATPATDEVPASKILFESTPSLIGTVIIALIAYFAIHRNQIRYARDSRRIERARLLADLDREYFALMASRSVHVGPPEAYAGEGNCWNLEYVLTSAVMWHDDHYDRSSANGRASRRVAWCGKARFANIATLEGQQVWLDTVTLHLLLGWFKRIDRGLEAGILHPDTVTDLWRNILPWSRANRFSYMLSMFGPAPGEDGLIEPPWAAPAGRSQSMRSLWSMIGTLPRRIGTRGRKHWSFLAGPGLPEPGRAAVPDLPLDLLPMFRVIDTVLARAIRSGRPEVMSYLKDGVDDGLAAAFGMKAWRPA